MHEIVFSVGKKHFDTRLKCKMFDMVNQSNVEKKNDNSENCLKKHSLEDGEMDVLESSKTTEREFIPHVNDNIWTLITVNDKLYQPFVGFITLSFIISFSAALILP